ATASWPGPPPVQAARRRSRGSSAFLPGMPAVYAFTGRTGRAERGAVPDQDGRLGTADANAKGRLSAALWRCVMRLGSAVAERGHPARLQEPAGPVAGVELGHGHVAPGAGGVQGAALADVDADVGDALATAAEEHPLAGHPGGARARVAGS